MISEKFQVNFLKGSREKKAYHLDHWNRGSLNSFAGLETPPEFQAVPEVLEIFNHLVPVCNVEVCDSQIHVARF